MSKFVKITKRLLTNGQHFSFMKAFSNVFERIIPESAKCIDALATLNAAIEQEDRFMKQERGSRLTKLLQEQDDIRDKSYLCFKSIITAWSKMNMEMEAKAAKELLNIVKLYNINTHAQIDEETGLMDNLYGDIKASTVLTKAIETLNLKKLFEVMVNSNDEVKRYLMERGQESVDKVVGALKTARDNSDIAYDVLAELVESLSLIADDTAIYEAIIREWNVTIERYKDMLKRKSTKDTPEEEVQQASVDEEQ